jgi:hypothetical protein
VGLERAVPNSSGERPGATYSGLTQDTDFLSSSPTFNYGYTPDFGCNGSPMRVGLLRFDIWEFIALFTHSPVVLAARLLQPLKAILVSS